LHRAITLYSFGFDNRADTRCEVAGCELRHNAQAVEIQFFIEREF